RRVVLHGPRGERQEGASPADSSEPGYRDTPANEHDHVDSPRELDNQFLQYLTENTEGLDLLQALKGRYNEDPFFARIMADPKHFKNFVVEDGLVFIRDAQKRLLCIPRIIMHGRSVREVVIRHAHTLLAHLGAHRTACLLRDHVWWKS
ncbi:hypothetical protein K466DRAFT_465438, partial [Polyporus arcularius HHB13444]